MPDDRLTPRPTSAHPPEEGITSQPPAVGRPAGDDDWFVRWGGKEVGPFTAAEMRANASGGALAPDDLVRRRDGEWAPAKDVPALAGHLRRRADTAPRSPEAEGPVGIGGWLILPAIGLVIGPFVAAWLIFSDLRALSNLEPEDEPLAGTVMAEAALNAGMLAFLLFVAVAFFRRKRSAPT